MREDGEREKKIEKRNANERRMMKKRREKRKRMTENYLKRQCYNQEEGVMGSASR